MKEDARLEVRTLDVEGWTMPVLQASSPLPSVAIRVLAPIGNSITTSQSGAWRTREWKMAVCCAAHTRRGAAPWSPDRPFAERPDGTRIWFTPYPTPLRDAEGRIIGGINMLVDITERKQAELLLQSEKKALQLVAEGASLRDVLQFLVGTVEAFSAGRLAASIALLNEDRTHFVQSVGPSLPAPCHGAGGISDEPRNP